MCLLWFCFTRLYDCLAKFVPFSQPTESQTNQPCLNALDAGYMCLFWVFIAWLCFLHLLWLAREITLVLVWQHSIENHSTYLDRFWYKVNNKGRWDGVDINQRENDWRCEGIPANFFWVKRVRLLSRHDRDFWKHLSHFRRLLTIFWRLPNVSENVWRYSDDLWTLMVQMDFRHLKAFVIVIKRKEIIHNKSEMK